jgi:hypothetical protein
MRKKKTPTDPEADWGNETGQVICDGSPMLPLSPYQSGSM